MIDLRYQKHFRPLQKLPFCYLCGRELSAAPSNLDHVPPKAIFSKKDRVPLKLPTHCVCNHAHHQNDEKAGQLIALRRGQVPSQKNGRLRFAGFPDEGHQNRRTAAPLVRSSMCSDERPAEGLRRGVRQPILRTDCRVSEDVAARR
jgi:hypothetical protein